MQIAIETVEPSGDDRDDVRMAWNMAQLIASNKHEKMTKRQFDKLVYGLTNYLKSKRKNEEDD